MKSYNTDKEKAKAKDDVDTIEKDLKRGNYGDELGPAVGRILRSYAIHDKKLGYTQGMHSFVRELVREMSEEDAFALLTCAMTEYGMRAIWINMELVAYVAGLLGDDASPFVDESKTGSLLKGILNKKQVKVLKENSIMWVCYVSSWLNSAGVFGIKGEKKEPCSFAPLYDKVFEQTSVPGWKVLVRVFLAAVDMVKEKLVPAIEVSQQGAIVPTFVELFASNESFNGLISHAFSSKKLETLTMNLQWPLGTTDAGGDGGGRQKGGGRPSRILSMFQRGARCGS